MFNNIGEKIKTLASVICIFGILSSVISGISYISKDEDLVAIGLIIMVAGSLASWVGSFMTYGFGQLIENTDILVRNSGGDTRVTDESATKKQRLETLNRWYDQGLITKEEYIEKARELK